MSETRYPLAEAAIVAEQLRAALQPYCQRIQVVGSVRRGKAHVKDLELLYQGIQGETPNLDSLFHEAVYADLAEVKIDILLRDGILAKRPNKAGITSWGKSIKLGLHVTTGLPVDLFAATPDNWFNLLVCRTGPAESNMRICQRAMDRGMKWEPYGPGLANRQTGHIVFHTADEKGLFERLGLPYEEPHKRR